MAENKKLIVRTSELFNEKNYKIRPLPLNNPLFPSLIEGEENRQVVGIHYDGDDKSVSELNNQSDFNIINEYRNEDILYTSVRSTEDTTLEYLPEHHHITELIENIKRMQNEYPEKLNMVSYLADKLFDAGYAKDIYYFGRALEITVANGIISPAFGYIIADDVVTDLQLNLIIRGIPVPMRKTLTSAGTFYFTYPQYLIDTDESVNSIQHIEVLNQGNSKLYKGTTTAFPLYTDSGDYINLRIINKELRNSLVERLTDPEWNS
jgi:hypothetical protein